MSKPIRVLIIEDSEQDAFFIVRHLEKHGYSLEWKRIYAEDSLRSLLMDATWDVILSDFAMPRFGGLEALEILKETGLDIPFIIVSGTIGEETAVSAMKAGACDYILKDKLQRLGPAVERELREAANRADRRSTAESLTMYMQRLEQSNRELEQFALVASHDLQEPLRKVRMFGEALKSSQHDKLDAQGLEYLERMLDAAARMQDLITDLLELSRVNRKGHPFKETNLKEVVSAAVSNLQFALEDSHGKVEVAHMDTIQADPKQMEQLFQNLIGNSLKFHKEGVPPVVRVSSQVTDGYCEVRVEDNGIGFDPQYEERIFKVFERLHSRSRYSGTGIGLAICKKIVDRHGGTIRAEGRPNEGATFTMRLPIAQNA